jgi:hypothetical protein
MVPPAHTSSPSRHIDGEEVSTLPSCCGIPPIGLCIGLPTTPVRDDVHGLRIGTPELARLGMGLTDMHHLASLIDDGLGPNCDHLALASRVTEWRAQFSGVHFTA